MHKRLRPCRSSSASLWRVEPSATEGGETANCGRPCCALRTGGGATFVRAGVAYSVTNTTDDPESISISIDGLESKITVVNVYHPASPPLQPGFYSRFFAARSGIVLGDFNAHSALFGSPSTDKRGRQLEDDMEANAYVALNTGAPTFLSNATGSTSHLDLAMASAPLARRCTWTVLDDSMGSDHSPILITIE